MTVASTKFLFIRHGESTGNATNIWTSAPHVHPLTELGHEQATAVGQRLKDAGVQALYSSQLLRARETAADIGVQIGLDATAIDGVQELHVGVHEGAHDDEVGPIAEEVFTAWLGAGDLSGGFAGGETGQEIVTRFLSAVQILAQSHKGETIAVVSHGGVLALGLSTLCPNLPALTVATHLLANCDVVEVIQDSSEHWRCVSWAGRITD